MIATRDGKNGFSVLFATESLLWLRSRRSSRCTTSRGIPVASVEMPSLYDQRLIFRWPRDGGSSTWLRRIWNRVKVWYLERMGYLWWRWVPYLSRNIKCSYCLRVKTDLTVKWRSRYLSLPLFPSHFLVTTRSTALQNDNCNYWFVVLVPYHSIHGVAKHVVLSDAAIDNDF
jgi:hypothetical protein